MENIKLVADNSKTLHYKSRTLYVSSIKRKLDLKLDTQDSGDRLLLFFLMKGNCFTILCWFLPYISINQPQG